MTYEENELLNEYRSEIEQCFDLAQELDKRHPQLRGAFTGTPSERIRRQLVAAGMIAGD